MDTRIFNNSRRNVLDELARSDIVGGSISLGSAAGAGAICAGGGRGLGYNEHGGVFVDHVEMPDIRSSAPMHSPQSVHIKYLGSR
jgi:hypothetical protein